MKILVTGGAGFIGSHVVDRFIEAGHEVIVADDLSRGNIENINPVAKFYEIDIRSKKLEEIFLLEKPDIVDHHAAQISVPVSVQKPIFDGDVNALGFLNILQNCVRFQTKKVIFISSGGAIYGEATEYPTSEDYEPQPLSPYAIHKFISEKYLQYYQQQFGLNYTVLRYANVFGPRQIPHGEAGVVSIFITKIRNGKQCHLNAYKDEPDGMIRDYVFVKDVVEANLLALEKGDCEAFNIGTNQGTTTGELFREISKQMNYCLDPIRKEARPGDLRKSCLNVEKAKRELGWEPKYSLQDGIKETIEFFS